jgi:uncharacterized LabA/DUF88 family protein
LQSGACRAGKKKHLAQGTGRYNVEGKKRLDRRIQSSKYPLQKSGVNAGMLCKKCSFRLTFFTNLWYSIFNPPGDSISGLPPAQKVERLFYKGLNMERIIAYIDGYNLYHGLKSKGWKWAYWLNIHLMIENLLGSRQNLQLTKYFTTRVSEPEDKRLRQQRFLEALSTIPEIKFFYGKYIPDTITCRQCGHTYTTYHEKMTDVNIAIEMMTDALKNRFDSSVLVSGDSDLVNLVHRVKDLFNKKVIIVFPPKRKPRNLRRAADVIVDIDAQLLSKSLFPVEVTKSDGYILKKPDEWQ